MSLGSELKRIRNLRGFSLREVERATGISNAYLSQLERSKASNPSPKMLRKIADHYGIDYESLMASAGYLGHSHASSEIVSSPATQLVGSEAAGQRPKSLLQEAIFEANLSEEDEKLVADYIAFLKSRNK